jgi:predicted transcriptional regulator with HTH domain
MDDDRNITSSFNYKRLLVIRSLRRSNIRKKIAEYLFEIDPVGSYTSEIADNINTAPTNVIGAIRGMGSRYKPEESLIALNLVEQVESDNGVKIYKLTDFGKEIINNLKK